jgi:hypothetical protein
MVEPDLAEVAQDVLRWAEKADCHGWYVVEADTARPEEPCFTIGHRAVDEDGVFQLRLAFDGWELLSRRGSLLVFETLIEALANICPVCVAA